jgi:hypothetical protein
MFDVHGCMTRHTMHDQNSARQTRSVWIFFSPLLALIFARTVRFAHKLSCSKNSSWLKCGQQWPYWCWSCGSKAVLTSTLLVQLKEPRRKAETVMWLVGKRRKLICSSEWKYWPSSPLLRNLLAEFFDYLSGTGWWGDSVSVVSDYRLHDQATGRPGFNPGRGNGSFL